MKKKELKKFLSLAIVTVMCASLAACGSTTTTSTTTDETASEASIEASSMEMAEGEAPDGEAPDGEKPEGEAPDGAPGGEGGGEDLDQIRQLLDIGDGYSVLNLVALGQKTRDLPTYELEDLRPSRVRAWRP